MQRTITLVLTMALAATACSGGSGAPAAGPPTPPTLAFDDTAAVVVDEPAPTPPPAEQTPEGGDQVEATNTPTATPADDPVPTAEPVDEDPEDTSPSGAAATFSQDQLLEGAGADMFIALDNPAYIAPSEATWLSPDDVVLGVVRGEEAVAFPVKQMAYHHIANTTIAGEPYLVTY